MGPGRQGGRQPGRRVHALPQQEEEQAGGREQRAEQRPEFAADCWFQGVPRCCHLGEEGLGRLLPGGEGCAVRCAAMHRAPVDRLRATGALAWAIGGGRPDPVLVR